MNEKIMRIARGWAAAIHHRKWTGNEEYRFYDIITRLDIGNKIIVFKGPTGSEYNVPLKRVPYLGISASTALRKFVPPFRSCVLCQ